VLDESFVGRLWHHRRPQGPVCPTPEFNPEEEEKPESEKSGGEDKQAPPGPPDATD